RRAWALARGARPDAGLHLDPDADLARRAEQTLGTPAFSALAATSGLPERELVRWALAWRQGGAMGFDVLRSPAVPTPRDRDCGERTDGDLAGTPTADLLAAARAALAEVSGTRPVVRANRVTSGTWQLRWGPDRRWYPYRRRQGHWEPAGAPDADPAAGLGIGRPVSRGAVPGTPAPPRR
ncbi:MAG TPA: hypothetical protein VI248_23585, partial [Kineosporiaceae bacterium]